MYVPHVQPDLRQLRLQRLGLALRNDRLPFHVLSLIHVRLFGRGTLAAGRDFMLEGLDSLLRSRVSRVQLPPLFDLGVKLRRECFHACTHCALVGVPTALFRVGLRRGELVLQRFELRFQRRPRFRRGTPLGIDRTRGLSPCLLGRVSLQRHLGPQLSHFSRQRRRHRLRRWGPVNVERLGVRIRLVLPGGEIMPQARGQLGLDGHFPQRDALMLLRLHDTPRGVPNSVAVHVEFSARGGELLPHGNDFCGQLGVLCRCRKHVALKRSLQSGNRRALRSKLKPQYLGLGLLRR
mmetsp:Transcript_54593/g.152323  ORF Transcript_54593/g.152323 Transcript_54593/m.152323 type:complete len:293 (+) Transcript_54593:166-1044(+)